MQGEKVAATPAVEVESAGHAIAIIEAALTSAKEG